MRSTGNPIIYLTGKLWQYSTGNRRWVTFYFLLFVLANGVSFLEPLVIARLLNIIQEQGVTGDSIRSLLFVLGVLLALNLAFWMFHGPARLIEKRNAFLIHANYKQQLLNGVMAFPLSWHVDHHSGDTIDKVEKGARALGHYAGDSFQVIESVVRLVSSYLALVYFNLHSAYIVFLAVVLTCLMIVRFDRVLIKQYRTLYKIDNKISAKVFDVISNITTVVILRLERLVSSSIYKKIMAPLGLYLRNNAISELKWFLVFLASSLMTVLVLGSYFYASLRAGQVVMIGTVFALYGYLDRVSSLFFRFAYMYGDIVQQKAAVMNAEEIANEFGEAQKVKSARLVGRWQELKVAGLHFSYHAKEGAARHLHNIDFTVRRGERVALVGASGSGKTTFLKIMRDLYQPQRATISLDGQSLKHGFGEISADIALIPQDPEIFATTIKENITVGVSHTLQHIKRCTDMACFTKVAERLPRKLDSFIYEKGVNLSSGEKQRLALARGLLACEDKAIVLLDEPTSSVDSRNEFKIYQNVFREFREKTIISSVHRLHLLAQFDRICFLKEGRLIGVGTLSELLGSVPEFRALWNKYHKMGKRLKICR